MATPPKRMQVFAPLKGSFPIDHFKECDEYYKNYMDCIKSNSGASTKCRNETKEYMECRMNKDLMEKQELKNLGLQNIPEKKT